MFGLLTSVILTERHSYSVKEIYFGKDWRPRLCDRVWRRRRSIRSYYNPTLYNPCLSAYTLSVIVPHFVTFKYVSLVAPLHFQSCKQQADIETGQVRSTHHKWKLSFPWWRKLASCGLKANDIEQASWTWYSRGSPLWISAGELINLTEVCHGFPKFLHANSWLAP
jgi:hypothetical protein